MGTNKEWEWWIDYIEGELDPRIELELKSLLQTSAESMKTWRQFSALREWLKNADPADHWPWSERLTSIRERVMKEIETENPLQRPPSRKSLTL